MDMWDMWVERREPWQTAYCTVLRLRPCRNLPDHADLQVFPIAMPRLQDAPIAVSFSLDKSDPRTYPWSSLESNTGCLFLQRKFFSLPSAKYLKIKH